nr:26s proteasome non-atpase regulatory subunit 9 [Quercus suber]
MSTSLTTFDGYPRADIDVAQIRTTRARIVRLKTDHKILMRKLEEAVHEQFALGKAGQGATTSTAASAPAMQPIASQSPAIEPPFAKVNTVVANSPAEQAGLKPGDKVIKFGAANWTNHERLAHVARVVQQNENGVILVKVLRDATPNALSQSLELRLTPRRDWGGRASNGHCAEDRSGDTCSTVTVEAPINHLHLVKLRLKPGLSTSRSHPNLGQGHKNDDGIEVDHDFMIHTNSAAIQIEASPISWLLEPRQCSMESKAQGPDSHHANSAHVLPTTHEGQDEKHVESKCVPHFMLAMSESLLL